MLPEEGALGCFWTSKQNQTSQMGAEGSRGGEISLWPPLRGLLRCLAPQKLLSSWKWSPGHPLSAPRASCPPILPHRVIGCRSG